MKIIGNTPEGDTLVALNPEETKILTMAEAAAKGSQSWEHFGKNHHIPTTHIPFAAVFGALRYWIRAKFNINDLQRTVDDLNQNLGIKDETQSSS